MSLCEMIHTHCMSVYVCVCVCVWGGGVCIVTYISISLFIWFINISDGVNDWVIFKFIRHSDMVNGPPDGVWLPFNTLYMDPSAVCQTL